MTGRDAKHSGGLWRAFDELTFGADRTLNLREHLPTAADARHRAEAWLRAQQVRQPGEVLIITGRGSGSEDGVPVVRKEILKLLPALRRRGVVAEWHDHTPGAVVVRLAPLHALLESPRRKRDARAEAPPVSLRGLGVETIDLLREVAVRSLRELGIQDVEPFVQPEMETTFSKLMQAMGAESMSEQRLREMLQATLNSLDASE